MFKNYSFLLFCICLFFSTLLNAQINQFEWGYPVGENSNHEGLQLIAADSAGNVFVTNTNYGSGNLSIGDTTLSVPLGWMFTAKIDETGHTKWVKFSTGAGSIGPEPYAIITDKKGDCYILGHILDAPTFHGVTIGNPNDDVFVIKVAKDGSIDWGTSWAGNTSVSWHSALISATIHNGSIRVGGREGNFYTQLDTANGNIQHQTTTVQPLRASRIITDSEGFNYFVFSDISIAPFTIGGLSYTPIGQVSSLILKQDSVGNSIWIKEISSNWHEFGDIKIGSDGSIYVIGAVFDSIQIDGSTFVTNPNINLFNFGSTNFVTKFDTSMNAVWTQYLGGSEFLGSFGDTTLLDLELDIRGNLYAAVASDGGHWVGNYQVVTPNNLETSLVAKLSPTTGAVTWVKRVEGYTNSPKSLAVSRKGIYLYGSTLYGQASFVNQSISNKHFITKLNTVQGTNQVSGLVFIDDNENGVRDNNEVGTDEILMNFNDDYYKYTDTSGHYSDFLQTGTYTIGTVTPKYWTQTRPDTTINFTGSWDIVNNLEFGVKSPGPIQDLEVYVTSTAIRPGFQVRYSVTYKNVGTVPVSGALELDLDATLNYISSTFNGIYSNSKVTWNYSNLQPGQTANVVVQCEMPVALNLLGTDLFATATIQPIATDTTPSNNIFSHSQVVTGSYDPNDKLVNPSGPVDTSFVSDGTFLYTIRFQNTGNDTAFTVRITDTLDNHLDISTLQIVGASHNYDLSLEENALVWTFNNILLPDSTTNEPASHGFIMYSIRPKANTVLDDTIANTAHIYFDFNPPIITNTTINDIQIITQTHQVAIEQLEQINVFPNPTRGWLTCEVQNYQPNETYFFRLFDLQGKLVIQYQITSERQTIDLPALSKGMYIYQLISAESELKGTGKILMK